jgi:type I restriction enzyme S subunit
MNINEQANFIWSIADLLRGDFKQSEYGKVILPFTVLRRFDCVLAPSKAKILEANKTLTVSNKRPSVEWLGEVPENWRIVPAKALFAQSKETRHETDVQLTASQKYGIISQEDYMEKQSYKIVLADKGLENWKHVEPNDFIISLRSFQGGLEISYIPGCITWHYIVLKPKAGVEPEYFKWLFKSPRYIQALQRTANFIRDGQDLRFSNFVQVPLPLIPMDEQKDIAEYLNKETARIDSIIADITEQIEKLKEYRQSVISEVVTGKVAVE